MRIITPFAVVCAFACALQAQSQSRSVAGERHVPAGVVGYLIGERDANQQVWNKVIVETNSEGQVSYTTNAAYVEVAAGLNYFANGQWKLSQEVVEPTADGAVARQGQHKVVFASDLATAGAIGLQMPDGKELRSHILGLSYFDAASGKSVMIAEVTNCLGWIVDGNKVVYRKAFNGVQADVRYTYTKGGFEQDVVLLEQPPLPEAYGLDSHTTVLQVITEFINPGQPKVAPATLRGADGGQQQDETLDFGTMRIGRGKAFALEEGDDVRAVPVGKRWREVQGRDFLIEEVRISAVAEKLDQLPPPGKQGAQQRSKSAPRTARVGQVIPGRLTRQARPQPLQMAKVTPPDSGFVLDYSAVITTNDFTFQGDMTYLISGSATLSGTTTIEGGTVIKYTNSPSVVLSVGNIVYKTGPYQPAVFTSMNDNGEGEIISGSTGSPSSANGATYLRTASSPTNSYLRFRYAGTAFSLDSTASYFRNCQFIQCSNAISGYTASGDMRLWNVLLSRCQTACNLGSSIHGENVTADQIGTFSTNAGAGPFSMVNSLLTAVTNLAGGFTFTNSVTNASSAGFYQTVGAGSYYLASGSSYRDYGTTNIDATLLAGLVRQTTYPPVVYANQTFNTPVTLTPQVQRDIDTPDLGYHYDPLDYVIGGSDLYSTIDVSAGTAVAWFEGYGGVYAYGQPYGLSINNGTKVSFQGTVTQPAWFCRFSVVQEGNGNWSARGWMAGMMVSGSGSSPLPEIDATFTRWAGQHGFNFFRDKWTYGVANIANSEFHGGGFATYGMATYFTNCLFTRPSVIISGDTDASSFTFRNCTLLDGYMLLKRYSGRSPSFWRVNNTAFDGVNITTYDQLGGNTNSTDFDYNSYNPSNTSWITHPYSWSGAAKTNVLETVGPHDLTVSNYDWQTGSQGDFYLPAASPLVNTGSTLAALLGLQHFTTQTNQVRELGSTVDIGFHYVALDASGDPPDTDGDGTPDYLDADSDNDGMDDVAELLQGRNPLGAGVVADTTGVTKLQLFTPLK